MKRVRRTGTPIEKQVAAIVRALGHRYRLNNRRLPGSPDVSNQRRSWAIFVNGCFWHGHKNCAKTLARSQPAIPKSNRRFWVRKLAANRARDAAKCRKLRALGFRVLIVWECGLGNPEKVEKRLRRFLESPDNGKSAGKVKAAGA